MWTAIKAFVGGNPYTLIIAAVAFLAWSAACGGYGYYKATGQYESALLSQQQAIAAAQHERDVAQHDKAVIASKLAAERKKKSETAAAAVQDKIDALPSVVTEACAITPDALQLLNEAGK